MYKRTSGFVAKKEEIAVSEVALNTIPGLWAVDFPIDADTTKSDLKVLVEYAQSFVLLFFLL